MPSPTPYISPAHYTNPTKRKEGTYIDIINRIPDRLRILLGKSNHVDLLTRHRDRKQFILADGGTHSTEELGERSDLVRLC